MNKTELIDHIYEVFLEKKPALTFSEVNLYTRGIVDIISEQLAQGHRAEFRGLGSFTVTEQPQRLSRNPRTGERITLPEQRVLNFKPGQELQQVIISNSNSKFNFNE